MSQLQVFYRRAARGLALSSAKRPVSELFVPSRLQLWLKRWDVFSEQLTVTRKPMKRYWAEVMGNLKRGKYFYIHPFRLGFMGFREAVLMGRFLLALAKQL